MQLTGIAKQIDAQVSGRARDDEAEYLANIFGLDYELPMRADNNGGADGASTPVLLHPLRYPPPCQEMGEERFERTSQGAAEPVRRRREMRLETAKPLFEDIVRAVGEATRVTRAEMHGRSRLQPIAYARQLAMYLIRQITRASYPRIGAFFGRTHATVIHACRLMRVRLALEPEARRSLDKIAAIFSDRRRT